MNDPFRRPLVWVATVLLATVAAVPSRAIAAAAPAEHQATVETEDLNVVFILADDLGYGDLGCYGNRVIRTPNLDRLAKEGTRLTACYAAAPVCSPSRAAILTGRTPNRSGIRDWIPAGSGIHLAKREWTLAEGLRGAGHRTGFVGKWHLSSRMDGSEPTPGDHGFDHWFATQNNAAPTHQDPDNFLRNGRPVGPLRGNSSTLIVDEAIRFLDDTPDDKRFGLFVWFHAPHEPVATPEEFTKPYAGEGDATKRAYYGSITLMDREVGRLLGELDARGLRENTVVVFTSDNGPETLGRYRGAERSHGSAGAWRGMKLHLYEGGCRVPGIVRWPGVTVAGKVSDEPVCGVDFLPTLLSAAGVLPNRDATMDGANATAAFRGEPVRREVPLYWQYDRAIGGPWRVALRDGPWKILADADLRQFALYHLGRDPAERDDLADKEPERLKELTARLRQMHEDVNRPAPPGEPPTARDKWK